MIRLPPSWRLSSDKSDLLRVLALVMATFGFAARVELFERVEKLVGRFEHWQLDELVFALISLASGLAWYARRRRCEASAALAEVRQAETRVKALLSHNRELAQQLISTQERERLDLARDLHDDIGQFCSAIRVEAECIVGADSRDPRGGAERIASMADELYDRVNALLRRLRPAELDALGLVAALQSLCEAWETSGAVACVLHTSGSFDDLGPEAEITLYRVAQEALSNVMRHAQAQSVRMALQRLSDNAVVLEVRDDGLGFNLQEARRGLGLLGAAERATALGGNLEVTSHPGAGTRLKLRLPAPVQEASP